MKIIKKKIPTAKKAKTKKKVDNLVKDAFSKSRVIDKKKIKVKPTIKAPSKKPVSALKKKLQKQKEDLKAIKKMAKKIAKTPKSIKMPKAKAMSKTEKKTKELKKQIKKLEKKNKKAGKPTKHKGQSTTGMSTKASAKDVTKSAFSKSAAKKVIV